jgi:alkylhydroperoxidase/carboxymuconolactone decarboxylase family protein YurZ
MKRTMKIGIGGVLGLAAWSFCILPGFAQTSTSNSGALSGSASDSLAKVKSSNRNTNTNVNSNKSNSRASSKSASVSGANAANLGSTTSTITFTSPANQTINNVPNIYAPGLTAAGTEVCLGSVSAGGAGAGFGLSIGGTFVDQECQLRLNAKTLATLGYAVAAREEMCADGQVRAAMLAAGTPCAADRGQGQFRGEYSGTAPQATAVNLPSDVIGLTPPSPAPGCYKQYQLFGGWYDVCPTGQQ